MKNKLLFETSRKIIHLSSLLIPLSYLLYGKNFALQCTMLFLMTGYILETLRFKSPSFNKFILSFFGFLMRDKEKKFDVTGAFNILFGYLVVIIFFKESLAFAAMLVTSISDSLASIIGRIYNDNSTKNKSLHGSAAFFISCVIITFMINYYFYTGFGLISIIFGSLLVTSVEANSKNLLLDDNFLVPVSYCLIFWYLA